MSLGSSWKEGRQGLARTRPPTLQTPRAMTLQAALLGAAIDDLFATGLVLRRSIDLADRVEVFFLDPLVVFGELLVSVDGRLFAPFDGGLFAAFVCGYVLGDVVCRYLLRDVDLRAPYGCREVGSTVEPKVPSALPGRERGLRRQCLVVCGRERIVARARDEGVVNAQRLRLDARRGVHGCCDHGLPTQPDRSREP